MSIKLKEKKSKSDLKAFIKNSLLNDKDKKVWNYFINKIDEKLAIFLFEVITEDKKNLLFLTSNLISKLNAISSKDNNSWSKIIKEEKKYLAKYS